MADYVRGGYGTGTVMAVPGHDERDFEFTEELGLPVHTVIEEGEPGECFTDAGRVVGWPSESRFGLNNVESTDARVTLTTWAEENRLVRRKVNQVGRLAVSKTKVLG